MNTALEGGIRLVGLRVSGGILVAGVRWRDGRRIRPAVRAAEGHARFVRRWGLPFALGAMARRPALPIAVASTLIALYVASGYVWVVRVQGAAWVSPTSVLTEARKLGLSVGVPKSRLDLLDISRALPTALPGLVWAGVSVHGVVATISVAERLRAAPAYEQATMPGDIVASTGGVVAAITALTGQAVVRPGTTVRPGQVLIRGMVQKPIATTRQSGVQAVTAVPVHAAGIVLARKWYAAFAQAPLTVDLALPTGRIVTRRQIRVGPIAIPLGRQAVPFASWTLRRQVGWPIGWRTLHLPVRYTVLTYSQTHHVYRRLSWNEAAASAEAMARSFLLAHLPSGARIVGERVQTVGVGAGAVGVELMLETEQNIGAFRPSQAEGGAASKDASTVSGQAS